MKLSSVFFILLFISSTMDAQTPTTNEQDEKIVRSIFDESLIDGRCYEADKAVDWAVEEMQQLGFDTVYKQACMVPHWERGEREYVAAHSSSMEKPLKLKACALGYSLGTPAEGIKGKIVKVTGLEDVEAMAPEALKGKIVYYSRPMDPTHIETFHAYGGCVDQRSRGGITAQRKGAIGVIVRSMGLRIDDYPHTGTMDYGGELPDIPSVV